MTTVLIVDDDRLVCEHMQERLDHDDELACAGIAHTAATARQLVREKHPDLIVLDIMLREQIDPIDLGAEMIKLSPRSRIVVCTAWSDDIRLDGEQEFRQKVRASRNGVVSWISKDRGIRDVIAELRAVARWCVQPNGPSPLDEALGLYLQMTGSAVPSDPFRADHGDRRLTPTEARVAGIVARGLEADLTIEEIARNTKLAPGTIRGHMKTIYGKWGIHTLTAFVVEVRRRGLISD